MFVAVAVETLFQALLIIEGLTGTNQDWTFDVPQYKAQLSQCLLLLSCGPVALTLALDILKLRRKENLVQPSRALPDLPGQHTEHNANTQQHQLHTWQLEEEKKSHQKQGPPLGGTEYCAPELYGQLISPSALDDLSRANFLLFDKGATVIGSTLQLEGICAGGRSFVKQYGMYAKLGSNSILEESRCGKPRGAQLTGELSTESPCQRTQNASESPVKTRESIVSKDKSSCTNSTRARFKRCKQCDIRVEDLTMIEHYYTKHRDERNRLETLAQVS